MTNNSNEDDNYTKLKNMVEDRIWYDSKEAFAFLVDAPMTFGHSQLVTKVDGELQEKDRFSKAAKHIAECIGILETTLNNIKLDKWEALAKYTKTADDYKKTLIVRASAEEKPEVYKAHLVPYFSSHHEDTINQFNEDHDFLGSKKVGGLVSWLGKRERVIDNVIEILGRDNGDVKKRIDSFKLIELTEELKPHS